ncbi:MAG TPA: hypothetical protein VFH22_00830 [Rhodocyclaceae bacterium]|nr:hypothetical protein [Rhodocyclaceae bacterium]
MNTNKLATVAAGLLLAFNAVAQEGSPYRETVGVDAHYESSDGDRAWSGDFSYARLFMNRLEIAGAYSFKGGNHDTTKVQSLQAIGRQWFGPIAQANTVSPFVQVAAGMEFANSHYENVVGVGAGLGFFVNNQSELRLTLKGEWGGFKDSTRLDAGYYYHF